MNSANPDFKRASVGELTPVALKTLKKYRKRRLKEIKRNAESKEFEFVAANDDFWYFKFTVTAGQYTGQTHIIEVKLIYGQSPDIYVYPKHAPKCTFITNIWHPNISDKGTICLDVLKDNWSPAMFSSSILTALRLLLECPETSSPQNKKASEMMRDSPEEYAKYIQEFHDNKNVADPKYIAVSALF